VKTMLYWEKLSFVSGQRSNALRLKNAKVQSLYSRYKTWTFAKQPQVFERF
jgi:hypothetical protein